MQQKCVYIELKAYQTDVSTALGKHNQFRLSSSIIASYIVLLAQVIAIVRILTVSMNGKKNEKNNNKNEMIGTSCDKC